METAKHRHSEVQQITFPNGNHAQLVVSPTNAAPEELLSRLTIPPFQVLFIIAGGAAKMSDDLFPAIERLFLDTITYFTGELPVLIIDGGTNAGIMKLMGDIAEKLTDKLLLLGVSPYSRVTYPGKPSPQEDENSAALDANHSHFVLVESEEWGGESEVMYKLAQALSQGHPSLAFMINGGPIVQKEALLNVRQNRPIIAIEGSGRVTDTIVALWREKPAFIADPELAEIIRDGRIYPFPLHGRATELIHLIQELLGEADSSTR